MSFSKARDKEPIPPIEHENGDRSDDVERKEILEDVLARLSSTTERRTKRENGVKNKRNENDDLEEVD